LVTERFSTTIITAFLPGDYMDYKKKNIYIYIVRCSLFRCTWLCKWLLPCESLCLFDKYFMFIWVDELKHNGRVW